MKTIIKIITSLNLLVALSAQAALVTNGDFQTCDFSHWDRYTDGVDNSAAGGDFNMLNTAGECQAEINMDIFNGATAFYANTLSTQLDLSAATNELLLLSFDWNFSGFDDESADADWFFVNLVDSAGNMLGADANHGFLMDPTSSYGAGSFSMMLDSSVNNQLGWFLDFTVEGGFTQSSFASTLVIDNVALTTVTTDVPEPPLAALFFFGAMAMFSRRK